MSEKKRKSKGVVLCRSKNQPNGKEIQGLVFDHPSMPKIVTISSGSRKKSSDGSKPTGHSDRRELNPGGEKCMTGEGNLIGEKYPIGGPQPIGESHPSGKKPRYTPGHFSRQEYADQNATSQQSTTAQYTPGHYSTVHKPPAQHPTRTFPPGLIPVSAQYSKYQQLQATVPNQNERSQVRFQSYHRNGQPSANEMHRAVTAAPNTQFQHSQHATHSQHTHEGNSRRHSTGALRNHLGNDAHNRENIGQQSIELGSDKFSRDFHLKIWRESHDRVVRKWNAPERGTCPPVRGPKPPERRLNQPSHVPITSGHYVNGSVAHRRSASAGESPSMALPPQRVQKQGGSPLSSHLTPMYTEEYGYIGPASRTVRRYSTGHVGVPQAGAYSSPDIWKSRDCNSVVRNTEGTNSHVSNRGDSDRTPRISTDGSDPLVRFTEKTEHRLPNAGNISKLNNVIDEFSPVVRHASNFRSSNINEEYSTVVQKTQGRSLESFNFDTQRAYGDNCDGYKPEVRNTDGANSQVVASAGGRSNSPRKELLDKIDEYQRTSASTTRRKLQRQKSPAIVVISDSDDEEMKTASPLWNGESEQDVFMAEPRKQTNKPEHFPQQNFESRNNCNSESEVACIITKVKSPTGNNTQLQSPQHAARSPRTQVATSKQNNTGQRYVVQNERVNCSGKTIHEFPFRNDVNNNESRGSVETSYIENQKGMRDVDNQTHERRDRSFRSVLCEREMPGQLGTQRVVMSEQVFDNGNRGTKRPLEVDKANYFVAGPAKVIGSTSDDSTRKIVRLSCDELQSNNSNSKIEHSAGRSGIRHHMFVNTGTSYQVTKNNNDLPKFIRSRSEGDTQVGQQKVKNTRSSSLTHEPRHFESKVDKCIITANIIEKMENFVARKDLSKPDEETRLHRDVSRDESIRISNVPQTTPKTGARNVICDEVRRLGNENNHTVLTLPKTGPKPTGIVVGIKQAPEVKVPQMEKEIVEVTKKPLQCNTEGSEENAKNSSVTAMGNSKDHEKSTQNPRDRTHVSQQWEAYSLKLENEKNRKTVSSCREETENSSNITPNSWEELRKMFRTEEEVSSESKRDAVASSDKAERSNETRKRNHSLEKTVETSCRKSYKFHDATSQLSNDYKRRKLSEDGRAEMCGRSYSSNSENETDSFCASTPLSGSKLLVNFNTDKSSNTVNHAIQTTAPSASANSTKDSSMLFVLTKDSDSRCVISVKPSPETEAALKKPLLLPRESPKTRELSPSEEKSAEVNTQAVKSAEVKPSETEPQAGKNPQNEEHSIKEWTEILQGRIAQVRESIEEETTPWKTKNKKKVLEKLENHLLWITGPDVDEAFFLARKLQFFQTMKKQYELMRKIKTQRQTMKCSDNATPAVEDCEKPKTKTVKEVGVAPKPNDVKAPKCRAKRYGYIYDCVSRNVFWVLCDVTYLSGGLNVNRNIVIGVN